MPSFNRDYDLPGWIPICHPEGALYFYHEAKVEQLVEFQRSGLIFMLGGFHRCQFIQLGGRYTAADQFRYRYNRRLLSCPRHVPDTAITRAPRP